MSTIKKINSSSAIRLIVALIVGVAVTTTGLLTHVGLVSILIGWEVAVLTFVIWLWFIIWPMDHKQTSIFALREDPGRVSVDVVLILASIASLGAVGFALFEANSASDTSRQFFLTIVSLLSVIASWFLIHTLYTLRYARFYYSKDIEGSVDFSGNKPAYADFVYLAFTIGMTYQVSDTTLNGTEFRKNAIRHALLSYLFGTVIVATTISLIAGLGSS